MFVRENQKEMTEYIELLVLAYFKQFSEQYSFGDISCKIGLSEMQVSDYVFSLVEHGQLAYEKDLLKITLLGRNRLANSTMENYKFDVQVEDLFENERWPLTRVYCPHEFSKKRWRGNR